MHVRSYAAHQIMRCWTDGDQIARQVESIAIEKCADAGEAIAEIQPRDVTHVQIDGEHFSGSLSNALSRDCPRHNIAWGKFEQRMIALHEALHLGVTQLCAFASKRLAQQKARHAGQAEGGGVKLVKLHVRDRGAST